ncbi:hypothetical protein RirG_090040 [Rhizophagus irregularis DAOM 197198w]|uniref:Uncharacterized protein n=1 Tax=Rhizophagus irregularis (strain DAOM 197198w) TaxID=1432141 RepID=A0A015MTV5_RHIIW|nr:hypothetical protein RirG_090040 [Rhizophagus irregularis DAOM 197198w]
MVVQVYLGFQLTRFKIVMLTICLYIFLLSHYSELNFCFIIEYHWKCLDLATNPMYLNDCSSIPSQVKFYISLLHQNYPECKNPFKIHGAGGTVLSWNKKENTVFMDSSINANNTQWCYDDSNYEDSFTIHPYGRPQDCLSAPLKEGDPVCVIGCFSVEDDSQILGISWDLLYKTFAP